MKCVKCGAELTTGDTTMGYCNSCHIKLSYTVDMNTPTGWRCPVCGRGLSPWVTECPCYLHIPFNVPTTSGSSG
jgi:DNA-directed RNA polymerase subunit RPC12/RpoP